ncbi:MAG TPA: DUF4229 domain-containing protein [Vicinamibacteria bacterium]
MKDFLVYTLLRVLLFAAVLVLVIALWVALFGQDTSILWPVLIAFLISGALSLFVLNRPREALARRVQARAERAAGRYERMRAKED